MKKIRVIYWTQSGNTQIMAQAVAKGITEAGAEVVEDEGIICMGEPDSDIINRCVELGRILAQGE